MQKKFKFVYAVLVIIIISVGFYFLFIHNAEIIDRENVDLNFANNTRPNFIWDYSMGGTLDNTKLECKGQALVNQNTPSLLNWKLLNNNCKGDKSVDWLHDGNDNGTISFKENAWNLDNGLPGNGFCLVENTNPRKDELTKFTLNCRWECRVKDFPCSGQATYYFNKKDYNK